MPADRCNRMLTRRCFMKTSAASGAALCCGRHAAPAVHAQARTIKLGYVSPQTGPLRTVCRGRQLHTGQLPRRR